ncbi:MAG: phage major capsid protein [Acidobacteriota bacterium]
MKMYSRNSNPGNAVWLANENTLPQLASMALNVGTGGVPVFLPANGAAGLPYNTLFGRPLIFNKHCSTLGAVGDLIFCDLSQYLVGMKSGQGPAGKFDSSIHLKFDADQTAFRFVFRVDGQPWWPSSLTPPQATTATISPFVSIAARP